MLDGYFGVWFFTTNSDFWSRNIYFEGTRSQSQSPIGAIEGHLSYDFKPRLWASLDGNFWFGGKTTVNGVQNPLSEETNSRIGGTASIPVGGIIATVPITVNRIIYRIATQDTTYILVLVNKKHPLNVTLHGKTKIALDGSNAHILVLWQLGAALPNGTIRLSR